MLYLKGYKHAAKNRKPAKLNGNFSTIMYCKNHYIFAGTTQFTVGFK